MVAPGTVVIDVMGGDRAPAAVVAGAQRAAASGVNVMLCGTPEVLATSPLPGIPSGPAVRMGEDPITAMRRDPTASIRVAARAVAASPGTALVSAGSTGATVAAALLEMGRTPGSGRPAIAARLPRQDGGHVVLLDAGADPDPRPEAFLRFAVMGAAYARVMGVRDPTIGLLNVGHEPGKGNELAVRAGVLLADVVGFCGNVEPADVVRGAVDVVLADGFTGNILLKALEARIGTGLHPHADRAALVLGVAGTVLVAHGSATAQDVGAAIDMAATLMAGRITDQVRAALHPPPTEPADDR